MRKLQRTAAVLLVTAGTVAVTAQPAQAATASCVVPWSGCETAAVPAEDGVIWVGITTPAFNLCDWRVKDIMNGAIIRTRTTMGDWGERITGVHSWYRLELTNCRTSSTGTIS